MVNGSNLVVVNIKYLCPVMHKSYFLCKKSCIFKYLDFKNNKHVILYSIKCSIICAKVKGLYFPMFS